MVILVRYAEIALKSRYVRNAMENALIRNLESKLIENKIQAKIERDRGHIYITSDREQEIASLVARTFGVVSYSHCVKCGTAMGEIERNVLEMVANLAANKKTFAIRARRAGTFGFTSMELARHLGSAVLGKFPHLEVNLDEPALEIHVEVRQGGTYIYTERLPGPGGLPYGTQGTVVALLGGRDDVVAAWLMMKRGCSVVAVGRCEAFSSALKKWNPVRFEVLEPTLENGIKIAKKRRAMGVVSGMQPEELAAILATPAEIPVFLPLAGLDGKTLTELYERIGVEEP
ncbi:MAG: THUMP domain-containing protein [Thermoplasmata archaeon]|nr:THUMP domain-containing protein [Thermoplasmata archaeon]